jgi:hypothetical protein
MILMVMAATVCPAQPSAPAEVEPEDWSPWQWEAEFQVVREGGVRLEIPPRLLEVSRRDLGDLRILSPADREVPYVLESPPEGGREWREAAEIKATMAEKETRIEVRHTVGEGEPDRIEAVALVSPAKEFLKSVTIEGRGGDVGWQGLATREPVFRQTDGAERLRIPIPAGPWEEFRIVVDDSRSEPVPFTGVRFEISGIQPETVAQAARLDQVVEKPGETRITLDLGARNLNLSAIRFDISDAVFSRPLELSYAVPTPDGEDRMERIAAGVIYRVAGSEGKSTEDLSLAIQRRIPTRQIVAVFRNGDSPPLAIRGAHVAAFPTRVVFHASQPGRWRVITDKPGAKAPDYDLKPLETSLTASGGSPVQVRAVRKKADYQPSEPLPGLDIAGAGINLDDWARRRPLDARPGVLRIELDDSVLAISRSDLGDLRLVQQGRQIPYLISPATVRREVKTTLNPLPSSPQRPSLGRWEVRLPVDGLPAHSLTARSSSPLFTRKFVASVERKDTLGNRWRQDVGSAEWVKSAEKDSSLVILFNGERLPAELVLETDHGDNPPIVLDEVVVRYDAPVLVAKVTDSSPVFLCYGNPKATTPQYDLRLVRDELLAAPPEPASLGEEEILKPDPGDGPAMDAGSPWLWLALGGVVAALLTIVAKLLPRQS